MLTAPGRTLLERWTYVLVLAGEEYVVPYTRPRWARVVGDAGYGADFAPFLERFLAALTGLGWRPGSYFPGGWYRTLQKRGQDADRVAIEPGALGPFFLDEVTVEPDGRWRVGAKTISGKVLEHFLRNLHFDSELGRYAIRYRLERRFETRYLHHRSPPIRVHRVTLDGDGVVLWLNTGERQPLRPETLRLDGTEQLYCAVRAEQVPAWFEEPARWELLKDAVERDGRWELRVGGQALPAALDAPWVYSDALPS